MTTAAAVAALAVAATGAWWPHVAPGPRMAPIAAVAAALAAGWIRPRRAVAALVAWIPAAVLLAGVPAAALAPRAWPALIGNICAGAAELVAPASGPVGARWPLVAVMLGSGALWVAGGALAPAAGSSTRRQIEAFCLLAAPWLAALAEGGGDRAGWQGAIVLLGGLLWFSGSRAVLALGVVAALLSVAAAQAVGPRTRWFEPSGQAAGQPSFHVLDIEPTYGPLEARRTGAPMFEVSAPEPALWRMQTLDYFDGSGWEVSPTDLPQLPQPGGRTDNISVRVLGLANDLVVSNGRIQQVDVRGQATPVAGEAWRVPAGFHAGSSYGVTSDFVHATPEELARDRAPLDPRAMAYARLGPARNPSEWEQLSRVVFGSLGLKPWPPAPTAPDPRVVALARRLSAGTHSEWDVVTRVERFLLEGHRFHYTTHVPPARPQPLVDFLLRSHAGYCQQFAGAAALLLRLAGVPTRVVAGFATGDQTGAGTYTVRDLDAHDWIEVYFQGYGWVPFNPTPAAASARVASGIDPVLTAAVSSAPRGPRGALGIGLAALAALAALFILRRRRARRGRDPLQGLLERLAGRAGVPLEPSSTLGELRAVLGRLGPRTAALAAETERARFAADVPARMGHARLRLARSLVGDLGLLRALLVWVPGVNRGAGRSEAPAADDQHHEQRQQ